MITPDDLTRLKEVPGILSVLPRLTGEMDVRTAAATFHADLVGVDERFIPLYRIPLVRGRDFLEEEILKKQPVCLLTGETAQELFPDSEAIGAILDMQGTAFKIIGVVNWDSEVAHRTTLTEADILLPSSWLIKSDKSDTNMSYITSCRGAYPIRHYTRRRSARVKQTLSHGDPQRGRCISSVPWSNL